MVILFLKAVNRSICIYSKEKTAQLLAI